MIRLGLCCINTELRKDDIFCSRTMIRARFTVEKAKAAALANIKDAETMMRWNHANGIHVFRLSSDIFPHATDLETEQYDMSFSIPALQQLGNVARECGQRITMHPGQFNQVGAKSADVFEKTVRDLEHHAFILDTMGMDESSILCIHGGGVYGDKESTMRRWIDQFSDLPPSVKRRIAIENCERAYSTEDCLELAWECRIPMIFDTHHDACFRSLHKDYQPEDVIDQLPLVVETWNGVTPLLHISEQRPDARIGAHSDFIENIPDYLIKMLQHDVSLDIEVEAKMKEQAIFKLYKKYPSIINTK
jgi:UV DNA damage endonuclease